jgi:hypothetical protein
MRGRLSWRSALKGNNHLAGMVLSWLMDWERLFLALWLIWTAATVVALIAVLFFFKGRLSWRPAATALARPRQPDPKRNGPNAGERLRPFGAPPGAARHGCDCELKFCFRAAHSGVPTADHPL